MDRPRLTRAQFLRWLAAGAATAAMPACARDAPAPARMQSRPIPSTGEPLPVVGCGTWLAFDVAGNAEETARLGAVLDALFAAGGRVIDSSPMYGRAEAMVGRLLATSGRGERAFVATKVWTSGRGAGEVQMRESTERLGGRVDLMQVHNLLDTDAHWPGLLAAKAEGRLRYLGLTHYTESAYAALEAAMQTFRPDFVQLNYALDDRAAERRLLPLAAGLGIAVIVNRPFGGGDLLKSLKGKPLPGVAAELGCTSWAQLALKFVLGHAAVTCVIPGTSKPAHMVDNAAAGAGAVADAGQRDAIVAAWRAATGRAAG
jgi:diketogulonate reductase-like aldo/keto reductase